MINYNEVYGFMPREIINRLSEDDRKRMFLNFVSRKPTDAGWYITKTVIANLGDDFIKYLFSMVMETMENEEWEMDDLYEAVYSVLDMCSSDTNILAVYVEDYLEGPVNVKNQGESFVEKPKQPRDPKTGRWIKNA